MKGRPEKVDLLKLYSEVSAQRWNEFLRNCLTKRDLATLERMLYGVQLGMSDLANKHLNTEKINTWFIRLQRSIENTMRDVIRLKEPHPLDNPKNASQWLHTKNSKRGRDNSIEAYLKKVRF